MNSIDIKTITSYRIRLVVLTYIDVVSSEFRFIVIHILNININFYN